MNADVMDLAARFAADPRFRLAYAGVAGETAPAQRMQGGAQGYAESVPPPAAIPVPGQTAQAVMPGGLSPEQRIGGAFEASGQNPAPSIPLELIAAALQQRQQGGPPSISGGPSMPGAQPPFQPSTGNGWVGQMMGSVGGEPEAGPLGRMLPAGVRNPLSDALSSLGGIDSTAPALSAFGQGFAGASSSRAAREDRKRAEQAAASEMEWKREDRAYDRQDRATDRAWKVEDRAYERNRDVLEDTRLVDKALLDKRKAMFDEIATRAGIERTRAETTKIMRTYDRANITPDQMVDIEKMVIDYGETLSGDYVGEEDRTAIKTGMDDYRQELLDRIQSGENVTGGTTNVPGGPSSAVNGLSGKGSYDSPLTGGAAEVNKALDEAPAGTTIYFLDENGVLRAEER